MKLYTEEQLIQAFKSGMNACMKHQDWALAINYPNKIELLEFMQSLTPIELPSDEEIEEIAFRRVNGLTDYLTPKELNCLREGYMNGMKLLINVIQGGNK